ncbi:MAG TPA: hypothetical protein VF145_04700 [Chitinophagaceae bacterium]
MFSWFRKRKSGPVIRDIVFATEAAKQKALFELASTSPLTVFVAWFENTRDRLREYFDYHHNESSVITYRELRTALHRDLVFVEHYPLNEKENNVFQSLEAKAITVYSSLDEPLFRRFGGDRISVLLEKMGLDENEPISHPLITKSIHGIQEKIAANITIDQPAAGMEEWMQKNVTPGMAGAG